MFLGLACARHDDRQCLHRRTRTRTFHSLLHPAVAANGGRVRMDGVRWTFIAPMRYTALCAALRHATWMLIQAQHRWPLSAGVNSTAHRVSTAKCEGHSTRGYAGCCVHFFFVCVCVYEGAAVVAEEPRETPLAVGPAFRWLSAFACGSLSLSFPLSRFA